MPSPDNLSQGQPTEDLSPNSERDFFRELGVRTFINAAGTYTLLSASLMLPEVVAAMSYSANNIRQQLRAGTVSVEAVPTYSYEPSADCEEIRFGVWMMQPNEAEIVAQRLREVFRQATRIASSAKNNEAAVP